eukprot:gb/GECH01000028.1/.p1 GENE.gb/GECH01000028.1/~~gb/GECH01000028.1/.p1  ORF type:complete len:300 (+),score=38.82 gb/GECH01000028.1/:1-900(+)
MKSKDRGGIYRELVAGTLSGAAGVITGNPLDTIRVRIQTGMAVGTHQIAPKYTGSTMDCVWQTFRIEGTRGFFKGMSSPLASVPFSNATIFAFYGNSLSFLRRNSNEKNPSKSILPEASAGFIAGTVNAFILCPVEHVKIQRQIDPTNHPHRLLLNYTSIREKLQFLKNSKILLNHFHGISATILRDAPGFACYFSSYEVMRRKLASSIHHPHNESIAAFTAGGMAGALSWIVSGPLDVIKSNMQADPKTHPTIKRCCSNLFTNNGIFAFFKGIQTSVLRALPTNAVIFLVYESIHKRL